MLRSDTVVSNRMENQNTDEYLQLIQTSVLQNLKMLTFAPSVQIQPVPPDVSLFHNENEQDREDNQPDKRSDLPCFKRAHDGEFF